jgi:hypothetical protein
MYVVVACIAGNNLRESKNESDFFRFLPRITKKKEEFDLVL